MTPEVKTLLLQWLSARALVKKQDQLIASYEDDRQSFVEQMNEIPRKLEDLLCNLEEPLGLRVNDEYIIVIQDQRSSDFAIQIVDFN